jgi:DNA repair exonuclease SbcCD nuclease subunit
MARFIHSSDLHLGKRFGNFSGDLPGRLREARHAVLGRLAAHARDHDAHTILLAGDTFDTETPAADIRRQALTEMAHHAPIRWVLLPGNHDSLQASELWTQLAQDAPDNVVLATEANPIELGEAMILLPAPCTTRRPGRDLTEWIDGAATPEDAIRIGLAHGAIQNFSEDAAASDVIAPDRATRAGLAYLALGDWHGALEVGPRTRYSGAPEPDRFKHDRPGEALLVDIADAGALPQVTPLPTATFSWRRIDLHLLAEDDPVPALDALLPELRERRHTLARIVASGHSRLAARTALADAIEHAAPDFAFLDLDDAQLGTSCEVEDLDQIDRGGALRDAANALLSETEDQARSAAERAVASAALARLYAYAQRVSS